MDAVIEFNPSYAMLTIALEPGESIKAEPGAMVAQQDMDMKTGSAGRGLLGGIRRMLGGESFFVNTFSARQAQGQVCLAPSMPGDIDSFPLPEGRNLFIQASSFLACTENVQIDSQFQGLRGLFSNESLFFLRAFSEKGEGTVFYNSYGAIKRLPVDLGKELVVDTGHLVAFTDEVQYSVGRVGGLRSLIGGGEGLALKFTGNGYVWVQTRNLASLADRLAPFFPSGNREE